MKNTAESSQTRSERREKARLAKRFMVRGHENNREVKFKAGSKERSISRKLARKNKEAIRG